MGLKLFSWLWLEEQGSLMWMKLNCCRQQWPGPGRDSVIEAVSCRADKRRV
ncbi:unnamed protein product [Staurois parvus]|uniref:Uncharacterized protein n=1 Tax=Staurois parvus TaxID=386267 RepID=A0ABN9DS07_9NEOB|nr:unnamed protein product [Staurois parvus]